ncbi:hypothetical protein LBMAG42_34820 [Deltaproteobacteria bacterium]|nr:hypothetical protein LBMAG42_34820 [Deltaproteobacteria bacterium]
MEGNGEPLYLLAKPSVLVGRGHDHEVRAQDERATVGQPALLKQALDRLKRVSVRRERPHRRIRGALHRFELKRLGCIADAMKDRAERRADIGIRACFSRKLQRFSGLRSQQIREVRLGAITRSRGHPQPVRVRFYTNQPGKGDTAASNGRRSPASLYFGAAICRSVTTLC